MRKLFAISILLFALADTVAATTVRLRESDRGVWGAELRACAHHISRQKCAQILPLVLDDNRISIPELRHLPNGLTLNVTDRYFDPSFNPDPQTIARAQAIFSGQPWKELGVELKQAKDENARLETALTVAHGENEDLQDSLDRARKELATAKAKLQPVKRPWLASFLEDRKMVVVGLVSVVAGILLTLLGVALSYQVFLASNRVLPKEEYIVGPDKKEYGFRLEDDNSYTCLDCEENARRNEGRGLRHYNLKNHIWETKIHSKSWVRDPIEKIA